MATGAPHRGTAPLRKFWSPKFWSPEGAGVGDCTVIWKAATEWTLGVRSLVPSGLRLLFLTEPYITQRHGCHQASAAFEAGPTPNEYPLPAACCRHSRALQLATISMAQESLG
jgi:hypothetical protein